VTFAKTFSLLGHIRIVVNTSAVQVRHCWGKGEDLVVDAAKHIPGGSFVSKLVDGSLPVVAPLWCEIGKVLNAMAAVSKCAIRLQIECCVGRFHIAEVGNGENATPEGDIAFECDLADILQIRKELVTHFSAGQRIVIKTKKWLVNDVD